MTSYQAISLDILQDMMEPILGEILVESLFNEKFLRDRYGSLAETRANSEGKQQGGRMEFMQYNTTLAGVAAPSMNGDGTNGSASNGSNGNSNSNGDYFQCSNCARKIAGSRFAAHIDKCFGGRTRK